MTTADVIISRLPETAPMITPKELADACFHPDTKIIYGLIDNGELSAVKMGGKTSIAREIVLDYIRSHDSLIQGT